MSFSGEKTKKIYGAVFGVALHLKGQPPTLYIDHLWLVDKDLSKWFGGFCDIRTYVLLSQWTYPAAQ